MTGCILQLACLVVLLPLATSFHGTHSVVVFGADGNPEALSGEVEAPPEALLGTRELGVALPEVVQSNRTFGESRPHSGVPRDHSMLQTSVAMQAAAAPPIVSLAEVQLQLKSRDGDAVLAIFVLVGVPVLVGIACLLLAPRGGKQNSSEDLGKSLPSSSQPGGAQALLPASRAPTGPLGVAAAVPAGVSWDPTLSLSNSKLARCDSLSSAGSGPPMLVKTSIETGTLCQSLVVPKASGVTLGLDGDLLACQQETVVDIKMKDSTSNEGLLRLLVSETGKDSGMLLESVLKLPIAILDTGAAVARRGQPPPPVESRRVLIRRDMDPSRAPFAVVKSDGAARVFKATRGTMSGGEGETLVTVLVDMGGLRANVVNAEGRLIASMESRPDPGGRSQRFLNICHGADAALVLCVVFSAIKLG